MRYYQVDHDILFDKFNLEFGKFLFFFLKIFQEIDRKEKARLKMTVPQCYTLVSLKNGLPVNMNELSKRVGISVSTTTRNVDRLVKGGYLERIRSKVDRRSVLIKLTPQGQRIVKDLQEREKDFANKVLRKIPVNKRRQVIESMNILVKALQAQRD